VAYTGYNPVLNPVFSAQNRIVTRVVAKQARTTKVENKFVNRKKKFKRILSCLFGGSEKFNLGEKNKLMKYRRKVQICFVGSVANSVSTPLEFAAFRSVFDTKYSRASDFGFFCPQPWFLRRSEQILPGKTPAFSC